MQFIAPSEKEIKMKNSLKLGIISLCVGLLFIPNQSQAKQPVKHHHVKQVKKIVPSTNKASVKSIKSKIKKVSKPMVGQGSWYGYESGDRYRHKPITASGEVFNPNKLTAAHRSLAFGTKVKVTNLDNKKTVTVIINDRGPFNHRIIDLSKAAAKAIQMTGTSRVSLTVLS